MEKSGGEDWNEWPMLEGGSPSPSVPPSLTVSAAGGWNGHRGRGWGGSWKLVAGASNSRFYTPKTTGERGLLSSLLRWEKSQGRTVIGQP